MQVGEVVHGGGPVSHTGRAKLPGDRYPLWPGVMEGADVQRNRFLLRGISAVTTTGVPVGATGVCVGRDARRCQLLIEDIPANKMVSGVQAFVMREASGLQIVHLGRNPTYVNGQILRGSAELSTGDVIQFEQSPAAVAVAIEQIEIPTKKGGVSWRLDAREEQTYPISETPFFVGGSSDDKLHVDDWPAGTLHFQLAPEAELVDSERDPRP